MKKKSLWFVAGLLAGSLVGASYTWFMHRQTLGTYMVENVAGSIVSDAHILMLLRNGDHEQLLQERQQSLDMAVTILALAGGDATVPDPLVKPLRNALNYYKKYPIATGDSETDAAIMTYLESVHAGEFPAR